MIKKQKGMTLVEVMVATVIFVLTFAVICSTYLLSVKGEQKQRVYIHFESMCLDIDSYSDKYGRNWVNEYFNIDKTVKDYSLLDSFTLYFDNDYERVDSSVSANYLMNISYEQKNNDYDIDKYPLGKPSDNEMVLSIKDIKKERFVIDELVYGSRGGRYEK